MKILSVAQIRRADQYTIENEPISSIDLMERASESFVNWFREKFNADQKVLILCGTGNNGGDGLAIARILGSSGYEVDVIIVGDWERGSPDFKINLDRLKKSAIIPQVSTSADELRAGIIVDGLFGSGLSRPVSGQYVEVIKKVNDSRSIVTSIDVPSGLFCDEPVEDGAIVKADYVISFQFPKLSFFLPQNGDYVKNWKVVNIGLDERFIASTDTHYQTIEIGLIKSFLKARPKFYHKGSAGRALLVTGSLGKFGASILCAKACLRSGIGLLELHIPREANAILQTAVPEAMVNLDQDSNYLTLAFDTEVYDVIGLGPGIGREESTVNAIKSYLEKFDKPVVLDADALNILSDNPELIGLIPANSILTPHPGELKRLVGSWSNDYQRLDMQKDFSSKNNVIVVLKNAHSSITLPDGPVYFNTTGNPGMATAGSGDVLTGIITGFLGQGYQPWKAALLSVYLHGLSGDIGKENLGAEESLIATDLIDNLPEAIRKTREL